MLRGIFFLVILASLVFAACGGDGTPSAENDPQVSAVETSTAEARIPTRIRAPTLVPTPTRLLDLIKKNEMNIYDIPIAEITQQYLGYLAQMKQLDLEVAGEFIVMAATLIYIKSKMLLPKTGDEEEDEGADPREDMALKSSLVRRRVRW